MRRLAGPFVAVVVLTTAGSVANAHRVRVFAMVEGRTVTGRGYMGGGARAIDCPVRIHLPDGTLLTEVRTDREGRFTFEATVRADLKIVLDAGPGHRAEYTLPAEEFPGDLPALEARAAAPPSAGDTASGRRGPVATAASAAPPSTRPALAGGIDEARMRPIVRAVVQEEVRPLREDILDVKAALERPGATEIIGGIGYVLGLMGLAAYFRSKAARSKHADQP